MATHSIAFAVVLALSAALSLPQQRISTPKPGEPEPLYSALIHFDGRRPDPVKVEVLVDKLGDSTEEEELKFQTGDPVPQSAIYRFIGAYGYIKMIAVPQGTSIQYDIYCTATLIDSQTILLASHCIKPDEPGVQTIFVYGYSDVRTNPMNYLMKSQNFAYVTTKTKHPNYSNNASNVLNDVALGRLRSPISSRKATPICLGSTDDYNTTLLGAGWGLKTCTDKSLETLRKAKATLVSNEDCIKAHWTNLQDQQLCTLYTLDNGDPAAAAPGDSGGPLFSYADPKKPVQLGVTSFVDYSNTTGDNLCVDKTVPQVYERVAFFKDFINSIATNAKWC